MRTLIAVAFLLAGVAIVAHCANVAKNVSQYFIFKKYVVILKMNYYFLLKNISRK